MPVPGKLEVTVKFEQLPSDATTDKNGWKGFAVQCGEKHAVHLLIRPRMWAKIEEASKNYKAWVAVFTGQMGAATPDGFKLLEPNLQVFDKTPKEPAKSDW